MLVIQSELEELERLFTITDKQKVTGFLNPDLLQLVLEAHRQIRKYFPDDPLELEVAVDPEEPVLTKLVIIVVSEKPFEETRQLDEQFGWDWWLANMTRADSKLAVVVE